MLVVFITCMGELLIVNCLGFAILMGPSLIAGLINLGPFCWDGPFWTTWVVLNLICCGPFGVCGPLSSWGPFGLTTGWVGTMVCCCVVLSWEPKFLREVYNKKYSIKIFIYKILLCMCFFFFFKVHLIFSKIKPTLV